MNKRTLNLGPFGIYLWGGILLASGLAVAGGAALTANSRGTIYPQQLANGTAVPGYIPVAGYCTDTATGTSIGTSANGQCWREMPTGLPSGGTPGQVPTVSAVTAPGIVTTTATQTTTGTATSGTYSFTATGTVTTTGTEVTMQTPEFDPMGIFYLAGSGQGGPPTDPAYARWNELFWVDSFEASGICSAGSDSVIRTVERLQNVLQLKEDRLIWPAGAWLAQLRAKVNTNSASIRVEVWTRDLYDNEMKWFDWTTDAFSNTDYAAVYKAHVQKTDLVANQGQEIFFRLYATCATTTTVTVDFASYSNGYATRLYSPITIDKLTASDIKYYGVGSSVNDELWSIANWRNGVDETLGTLDEGKEDVTWGTPGQFVKFIGTGTSATTSKGAAYPATPSTLIQAPLFLPVDGAVDYSATTWKGITLADGAVQSALGAFFTVPNNPWLTTVTVRPAWVPRTTDASSHTVRWIIYYQVPIAGDSISGGSSTAVYFTGLAGAKTANRYQIEDGVAIPVTPGQLVKLGVTRVGNDAADTYVGDLSVMAVRIDYAP